MYSIDIIEFIENGDFIKLKISVFNNTKDTWESGYFNGAINLIFWWDIQNKEMGVRHRIFKNFKPGQRLEYTVSIKNPLKYNNVAKNINLNIDIKKEGFYWFRDKLNETKFIDECKNLIPYLPKEFPKINKNSSKKSLLIETRELKHNEFVIKNTIQKLGNGWGHIIYCHENNYNQIKFICDSISKDIEIRLLDFELSRNSYNNLLLNLDFWDEINCEKVLIYQTDTFIFNEFDNEFLQYDYLGANWDSYNHMKKIKDILNIDFELFFGNGGLSLRTVKLVKKALSENVFTNKYLSIDGSTFKLDKIPEDIFFSLYTYHNGKYNYDNSNFSIEFLEGCRTELNLDSIPFGYHKLDKFNNWERIILKFKNRYE